MSNIQKTWTVSNLSINDSFSFPGRTLKALYDTNLDIGYILYNDQFDKVSMTNGHTKGIILFDNSTAIWLIHSIPHFPPKQKTGVYAIQPPQTVFGQSMLCLSFSIDQLETIGKQILINYPQIYDYKIPEHFQSSILDNLIQATQGVHLNEYPFYNIGYLQTLSGEKFISFAKSSGFEDDLYSGIVAETLQSDVLTETWMNGPGNMPSNCTTKYKVRNIEEIRFDEVGLRFTTHHDHSKWAVTTSESHPKSNLWVNGGDGVEIACVGDINRQHDQVVRAGGLVCFMDNQAVWQEFRRIVSEVEPCQKMRKNLRKTTRKFKVHGDKDVLILL